MADNIDIMRRGYELFNKGDIQGTLALFDENISTPAQIALAWLLAQKPWIVPIPGTTKPAASKRKYRISCH